MATRTGTPIPITIIDSQGESAPAYYWPDGSVTRDAGGQTLVGPTHQPGGKFYSQVTAALALAGRGGTGTGGTGNPLTGGGLKPGFGTGPGLTPPGTTNIGFDDPNVLGIYNRDPNWLANFVTPAGPYGGPVAAAGQGTGTPTPTPIGPPPNVPPGTGSGSGTGVGGNEGGAAHAGEGSNQGGGGSNTQGTAGRTSNDNQGNAGRESGANAPTGANVGPGYHDTGTDSAGFARGGFVGGDSIPIHYQDGGTIGAIPNEPLSTSDTLLPTYFNKNPGDIPYVKDAMEKLQYILRLPPYRRVGALVQMAQPPKMPRPYGYTPDAAFNRRVAVDQLQRLVNTARRPNDWTSEGNFKGVQAATDLLNSWDNAGSNQPPHMAKGGSVQPDNRNFDESGGRFINLGPVGANALQAGAMLAPGYAGMGLSALQAGLRGYNTYQANEMRPRGMPLSVAQWAGALTGGNNYGSLQGNNTIRNPEQGFNNTAVTTGGMYDRGLWGTGFPGPFGIFSDPHTAYTPTEAAARQNSLSPANPVASNPTVMGKKPSGPMYNGVSIASYGRDGQMNLADGRTVDSSGNTVGFQGVPSGRADGDFSSNAGGQTTNGPLGAYGNPLGAGGSNQQGGQMAQGGWVNRAQGGGIPGNPLVGDNVLIKATPGEFMVNRDSSQALGPHTMHMLNDPQIAQWVGQQMEHLGGNRGGGHTSMPSIAPSGQRPEMPHGDHLTPEFMAAIMHPRHADKLAALLGTPWEPSWAQAQG